MELTDVQANKIKDAAGEIQDGLYAFANQAMRAIDVAHYVSNDTEVWEVTEYEFSHPTLTAPEAYNISEIENVRYADYKQTVQANYTTREEMLAHMARFLAANHF